VSGFFAALADVVVGLHFAYLAVLVFGGVAAWRWRRLLVPHLAAVVWALGAVTLRYDCPLTSLEAWLRRRAGQIPAPDGFLRHDVRGVLFPDRLTPYVVAAAVAVVVTGWLRLASTGAARTPASGCR
jgi:Protein of Unknown function (DUF2784)